MLRVSERRVVFRAGPWDGSDTCSTSRTCTPWTLAKPFITTSLEKECLFFLFLWLHCITIFSLSDKFYFNIIAGFNHKNYNKSIIAQLHFLTKKIICRLTLTIKRKPHIFSLLAYSLVKSVTAPKLCAVQVVGAKLKCKIIIKILQKSIFFLSFNFHNVIEICFGVLSCIFWLKNYTINYWNCYVILLIYKD